MYIHTHLHVYKRIVYKRIYTYTFTCVQAYRHVVIYMYIHTHVHVYKRIDVANRSYRWDVHMMCVQTRMNHMVIFTCMCTHIICTSH